VQAHAKGALAVRPQQHVAMRGLCAAMLTGLSTTTLPGDGRCVNRGTVSGFGWGSVVRDADGYAPTEVWEKYCGERSTIAAPLE
jgi:hypothetical protein